MTFKQGAQLQTGRIFFMNFLTQVFISCSSVCKQKQHQRSSEFKDQNSSVAMQMVELRNHSFWLCFLTVYLYYFYHGRFRHVSLEFVFQTPGHMFRYSAEVSASWKSVRCMPLSHHARLT